MDKHRIRVLGCSILAALGLLALAAMIAQAKNLSDGGVAGKFRVDGSTALAVNATFAGQLEGLTPNEPVHMVLRVPDLFVLILCVSADTEEGKILAEDEALVKVKFLGCTVISLIEEEEKELSSCKLKENALVITTKILPKIHENDKSEAELYLLFEGDPVNTALGKVEYAGKECALSEAILSGSAVALVKEGSTEQLTKLLTFSEDTQLLFQERNKEGKFVAGDRLLFGNLEAYLSGSATVTLTGSHINKKWSLI
jgi:hypothetical protein